MNFLSCRRATRTTAHDLNTAISALLQLHGVSPELAAQTYDGFYNGLHATVKKKIGNHIICNDAFRKR